MCHRIFSFHHFPSTSCLSISLLRTFWCMCKYQGDTVTFLGPSRGSYAYLVGTIHSKFLIIASQILICIQTTWGHCHNASSVGWGWGSIFACLTSSQVKPLPVAQALCFELQESGVPRRNRQEMTQLCRSGHFTSFQAAQQKAEHPQGF